MDSEVTKTQSFQNFKFEEDEGDELKKAQEYLSMGDKLYENGNFQESKVLFEKCLRIRSKYLPSNDWNISDVLYNLGMSKEDLNELESSSEDYRKCLSIRKLHFPNEQHSDIANCYDRLGDVYRKQNRFSLSEIHLKKGLEIRTKRENHQAVAGSCLNLGVLYSDHGKCSLALEYFKKAVKINEEKGGKADLKLAMCYNNIGCVYLRMKEYSNALTYLEKCYQIRKKLLPQNHVEIADSCMNLGIVHFQLENNQNALEMYQICYPIYLKVYPGNHPRVIAIYENLGVLYELCFKNYEQAHYYYQKGGFKLNHHLRRVIAKISKK